MFLLLGVSILHVNATKKINEITKKIEFYNYDYIFDKLSKQRTVQNEFEKAFYIS